MNVYLKALCNVGNGKMPVDTSTGSIMFPEKFGQFTISKGELISNVLPNIGVNYKNHHAWLSERAMIAAKNKDIVN